MSWLKRGKDSEMVNIVRIPLRSANPLVYQRRAGDSPASSSMGGVQKIGDRTEFADGAVGQVNSGVEQIGYQCRVFGDSFA